MYQVSHNFSTLKEGETICYHIGNLAEDRVDMRFPAKIGRNYTGFTEDAIVLQNVADDLYRRSCASWDEGEDKVCGTGEFELKQKRLGFNKYAYLAKRIK